MGFLQVCRPRPCILFMRHIGTGQISQFSITSGPVRFVIFFAYDFIIMKCSYQYGISIRSVDASGFLIYCAEIVCR